MEHEERRREPGRRHLSRRTQPPQQDAVRGVQKNVDRMIAGRVEIPESASIQNVVKTSG